MLSYLFDDSNVAKRVAPYKAVGEVVIAELEDLFAQDGRDPYNDPMYDFRSRGQWSSKLFVGIRFFDIMVSKALLQNITWHMWLYYFPHFSERIVRNLNPNDKVVDLTDEWPTKYHYALYEIVSTLCDWITMVEHIDPTQENVKLESTAADHENGNIPKSSMLALGQVTRDVLSSDKFTDSFKNYISSMAFRSYFDLKHMPDYSDHADALITAVKSGGFALTTRPHDYIDQLRSGFVAFDKIPFAAEDVGQIQAALDD